MKTLKISVAVVLLALAGAITIYHTSGGESVPDTPESRTQWMCAACGHPFQLTAREADEASRKGPQPWPPAFCPKCQEKKAFVARRCRDCGTFFFGPEVEGHNGDCPACRPSPASSAPVDDGETPEPERPRPKVS